MGIVLALVTICAIVGTCLFARSKGRSPTLWSILTTYGSCIGWHATGWTGGAVVAASLCGIHALLLGQKDAIKAQSSQWAIARRRFGRHRLAMFGFIILVILYTMCIFADFIAPYHFSHRFVDYVYKPPAFPRFREADSVRLKNGEVLQGEVVERWTGKSQERPDAPEQEYLTIDAEKVQIKKLNSPPSWIEEFDITLAATGTADIPMSEIESWEYGASHLRPFIYRKIQEQDLESFEMYFITDFETRYPLQLFAKGDTYHPLGWFPETNIHLFGLGLQKDGSPIETPLFLFGGDHLGRDLFSRVLYGSWVSMTVGLVGVSISFTLGMFFGGISGYFGGNIDIAIQRICEALMLMPGFYILIALSAAIPPNISSVQVYFCIIFILSFIGWAGLARTIRGMVLSVSKLDFVTAARALGQNHLVNIVQHVLPATLSYAIVAATISIPGYILGESALSLLGLGITEPNASWGNLLRKAMDGYEIKNHPWILIPGFFIFITVVAFNLLGDGIRDAVDPKMVIGISQKKIDQKMKKLNEIAAEAKKRDASAIAHLTRTPPLPAD